MRNEHEIVALVEAAQRDSAAADALVRQYLPFIKSETAKFIHRIPREGVDDELGIAMFAFYEAAMAYRRGRGAFLPLAARAIRNRLIDFARREARHGGVLSLEEPAGEEEGLALADRLDTGLDNVAEHQLRLAAREEIGEFGRTLSRYGISMTDVAEACPRQARTLEACHRALRWAKGEPGLLEELMRTGRLPIAALAKGAGVERKTLERHRKYMMAILLAYTNGFEIIRGHLQRVAPEKGGGGQ